MTWKNVTLRELLFVVAVPRSCPDRSLEHPEPQLILSSSHAPLIIQTAEEEAPAPLRHNQTSPISLTREIRRVSLAAK